MITKTSHVDKVDIYPNVETPRVLNHFPYYSSGKQFEVQMCMSPVNEFDNLLAKIDSAQQQA